MNDHFAILKDAIMRRTDAQWIAALLAGLAAVLTATSAPAAVWHWACHGEVGDQRILFDRDGLCIAGGKAPNGKPAKLTAESIEEAIVLLKKGGARNREAAGNRPVGSCRQTPFGWHHRTDADRGRDPLRPR